jgi:hypothetical protein
MKVAELNGSQAPSTSNNIYFCSIKKELSLPNAGAVVKEKHEFVAAGLQMGGTDYCSPRSRAEQLISQPPVSFCLHELYHRLCRSLNSIPSLPRKLTAKARERAENSSNEESLLMQNSCTFVPLMPVIKASSF